MRPNKIFVPKSFAKEVGDYGTVSLSFDAAELVQFIHTHTNSTGKLRLNLCKKREAGKFGETHYLELDQWKPDANQGKANYKDRHDAPKQQPDDGSSVPF